MCAFVQRFTQEVYGQAAASTEAAGTVGTDATAAAATDTGTHTSTAAASSSAAAADTGTHTSTAANDDHGAALAANSGTDSGPLCLLCLEGLRQQPTETLLCVHCFPIACICKWKNK